MSPSPQPPHGQANSVSATLGRAIAPVLVLLFVTVALALLSVPAAGQLAADPAGTSYVPPTQLAADPAGTSHVPPTLDTAGEPVTGTGLATIVGPTSTDAEGDRAMGTPMMEDQAVGSASVGDGLEDGRLVASHENEAGAGVSAVADGTWYSEETHLTATSQEGTATLNEPAEVAGPLVPRYAGDDVAFGAGADTSDYRAGSGGANGNLQGESFERPWGLNPSAPVSPATVGGIAFGFLLGAGAFAVARPEGFQNGHPVSDDTETQGSDPVDPPFPDDDHVPDEAVIEGILLKQDGRMKQSAIVNMTDWSKAKVSRVLSAMADEGRVVKVRIGRENLICLDGWEPDALKHPYAA